MVSYAGKALLPFSEKIKSWKNLSQAQLALAKAANLVSLMEPLMKCCCKCTFSSFQQEKVRTGLTSSGTLSMSRTGSGELPISVNLGISNDLLLVPVVPLHSILSVHYQLMAVRSKETGN